MHVKINVKGLELTYQELQNIKALTDEMMKRIDNIRYAYNSIGIEISEYPALPEPEPIENIINDIVDENQNIFGERAFVTKKDI